MDLQRDIYMQLLDFRMALRDTRMSDNGIVAAILRWDNSSEFIDYSNASVILKPLEGANNFSPKTSFSFF